MEIDWEEVNLIIQEWSSKWSFMKKPNDMPLEDFEKIRFLIDEIYSFPDNQKSLLESAALFEKHLNGTYSRLSPKSINWLVDRFCFSNR
ncbi:hypothetical protein A8F94_09285 [Bacillus sp. FJAT-27225]|uniref:hypothetical protein n=1 Tax=Bacillus sp. FJAT-27225 TaxID=1743144 RepID=UPI00080C2759|nr:hypothetical protein [Bacillus sp. FJAT-27225]OCA88009.1 hypothetical protein A8F94_09285 [Bacillus sp. FJAT-27225]